MRECAAIRSIAIVLFAVWVGCSALPEESASSSVVAPADPSDPSDAQALPHFAAAQFAVDGVEGAFYGGVQLVAGPASGGESFSFTGASGRFSLAGEFQYDPSIATN